jgi:hypothetical protein
LYIQQYNFKLQLGINIEDIGSANQIYSNTIINATSNVDVEECSAKAATNVPENNKVLNSQSHREEARILLAYL